MKEEKESYFKHLKKEKSNIASLFSELSISMLPFTILMYVGLILMNLTQDVIYLFVFMGIGAVVSVIFTDYRMYKKKLI